MAKLFKAEKTVSASDCDENGVLKMSALLEVFQEAAKEHSVALGSHQDILYKNYGVIWMVGRTWAELKRPIRNGERIDVVTWQRGITGAIVYRDFDILINGELVGEGVTAWILTNFETRALVRPSSIKEVAESANGDPNMLKNIAVGKIKMPEDMSLLMVRTIDKNDIDLNGHMNNVRYADIVAEALQNEINGKNWLAGIQINYSVECLEGETINIFAGARDDVRVIKGADDLGKIRFEASVKVSDLDRTLY